jgi:hypothetical protein
VFIKIFWLYQFVSLAITSPIYGVQNNSKYSRELLESPESTFMPGLQVNGKHDHSAPDFVHKPCCLLLLSLTFSSSSELTLCSSHHTIFTFISLSLLFTLQKYHCINSFAAVQVTRPHHSHLLTRTCHNIYKQELKPRKL